MGIRKVERYELSRSSRKLGEQQRVSARTSRKFPSDDEEIICDRRTPSPLQGTFLVILTIPMAEAVGLRSPIKLYLLY